MLVLVFLSLLLAARSVRALPDLPEITALHAHVSRSFSFALLFDVMPFSVAACATGKYKSSVGPAACTSCPANTWSPVATTSLAKCECVPGYLAATNGSACSACPVNTFKSFYGPASSCISCPGVSVSPFGSSSLLACSCPPGTSGNNGTACTRQSLFQSLSLISFSGSLLDWQIQKRSRPSCLHILSCTQLVTSRQHRIDAVCVCAWLSRCHKRLGLFGLSFEHIQIVLWPCRFLQSLSWHFCVQFSKRVCVGVRMPCWNNRQQRHGLFAYARVLFASACVHLLLLFSLLERKIQERSWASCLLVLSSKYLVSSRQYSADQMCVCAWLSRGHKRLGVLCLSCQHIQIILRPCCLLLTLPWPFCIGFCKRVGVGVRLSLGNNGEQRHCVHT